MALSYKGRNNVTYVLGNKIKGGGEGTVYEIVGQPSKVAKIYLPNILSERKNLENKILCMIKHPVNNTKDVSGHVFICWPEETLYNASGSFCGFIMPRATSATQLHFLYLSDSRKGKFPKFTWKVLLAIAYNLSHAVDAVHSAGHIVGDFNPNNILVDNSGKVTLIDVDSFDISADGKRYPCEVGVEDYLAPELQGKNLKHTIFTKNSDRFSLAIHIFLLLMDGNHPFHSIIKSNLNSTHSSPIATHIALGQCGYIKQSCSGEIPPGSPPYTMLPQKIRDLFLRVFNYNSATNSLNKKRPSAYEWASLLLEVYNKQATKVCTKEKNHVYPTTIPYCPWCECEKKKEAAHRTAINQQSSQMKYNPFYVAPPAPTYTHNPPVSTFISSVHTAFNNFKTFALNMNTNWWKLVAGVAVAVLLLTIIVSSFNNKKPEEQELWGNTNNDSIYEDIPDNVETFSENEPTSREASTLTFNSHEYAFYDIGLTWNEAKIYCENLGGHLVTITSQEEQNFICQLIQNGTMSSYWLGAKRSENDWDSWEWITDETFSFAYWDAGEPNGSGDCLQMYNILPSSQIEYAWDDTYAEGDRGGGLKYWEIGFICEWDTINSDVVSANNKSIPLDSISYNGHSYKIYDIGRGWGESKKYCEDLGGYLATISSAAENEFLYNYMISSGIDSAYFGFEKANNTWTWVNGDSATYTNWAPGEPNNENGTEKYGMFYWKFSDGTWNDGDFGNSTNSGGTAFICEWD